MSDLTVFAEALISTVARAFYDDETICIIDVLIRDKFLRDDDMAPRLNLPARKLRSILQFLIDEHFVRSETVDDLAQGGSQATKFYYLDYNRAVHSIRLRTYLWKKKLQQEEIHARSQSYYLCPGYSIRRCNGRYTEEEAQHMVNVNNGLFVCKECYELYENDPNQPDESIYTLQLVDNTKELRIAMDNLRRVNVQLSAKFIGNEQLRPGIYDLLQKVRSGGKANSNNNSIGNNKDGANGSNASKSAGSYLPITSNLPSENFALGIGSKRLAGTGRTAGIKEKKLLQQGVAQNAAQARNYLVGDDDNNNNNNNNNDIDDKATAIHVVSSNKIQEMNLLFLKNAMGNEIQFTIERGGAARAQLLVDSSYITNKLYTIRKKRKLMDAAASRVGSTLPIPIRVQQIQEKKLQNELIRAELQKQEQQQLLLHGTSTTGSSSNSNSNKNKGKSISTAKSQLMKVGDTFDFLKDNIGRGQIEQEERLKKYATIIASGGTISNEQQDEEEEQDNDDDDDDIITQSAASLLLATDSLLSSSSSSNAGGESGTSTTTSNYNNPSIIVLSDDTIELAKLSDDRRLATFQAAYNLEMHRQEELLRISINNRTSNSTNGTTTSATTISTTNGVNNNNNNNNNSLNGGSYHGAVRRSPDYFDIAAIAAAAGAGSSTNDTASVVSSTDEDLMYVQWEDGEDI